MKMRTLIFFLTLILSVVTAHADTANITIPGANFSIRGNERTIIGTFTYSLPVGSVITGLTLYSPLYSFLGSTDVFALEFSFDDYPASSLPLWPGENEFFLGSDMTHMVQLLTWDGSLNLFVRCWLGVSPDTYTYIAGDNWILAVDFELAAPPRPEPVSIYIKPGSDVNSINLKSKGVVPVARLTTPEFDARTVDPETVRFADASPIKWTIEDVDYDGDMDMLLHFKTQELSLDASSTMATLTGMTYDWMEIAGTDSVRIVGSVPPPSCTPPPSGLVSWWRGEDGVDSIGPNNGILQGGNSIEPGRVGSAFTFDGIGGYVEATDTRLPMGSAPRTLEFWVKPEEDARVPFIYGNYEGYDAYYVVVMGPNACIGQWGGYPTEPCGKTNVTDGKWHHVALTYDGANAQLYVDGALEVVQKKVYATTSTGRAYIGTSEGGGEEYFSGLVDEVSVYSRALSPSEIRSIFASGSAGKCQPVEECFPPAEGLTGWWPGDGNAGDIIGNRSAVLKGDATFGPGLVDQAFILDGEGDFVDVPDDEALNVGTGDFTVDLWAFFNNTKGIQVLLEKWVERWTIPPEGWTLEKDENVLHLAMAESLSGKRADVYSDPLLIPASTWTHFAATRQGDQITLFMNGVPVAQGESSLNLDSNSSLKFGHRGNPDDTPGSESRQEFYLNGRIDEVELSIGKARTHAQIQAIFNARSAGKCKEQ